MRAKASRTLRVAKRVERALRVIEDFRAALLTAAPPVPPPTVKKPSGFYVAGVSKDYLTRRIVFSEQPRPKRRMAS